MASLPMNSVNMNNSESANKQDDQTNRINSSGNNSGRRPGRQRGHGYFKGSTRNSNEHARGTNINPGTRGASGRPSTDEAYDRPSRGGFNGRPSRGESNVRSSRGAYHTPSMRGTYDRPSTNGPRCYTFDNGRTFNFPRKCEYAADNLVMFYFKRHLKCVGGYSEDGDKNYQEGKSQLSFLKMEYRPDAITKTKDVRFDLKVAQNKTIPYLGTKKKTFDNLLTWILNNKEQYLEELSKIPHLDKNGGNFVFSKGFLTKMMIIPNFSKAGGNFFATWFNGTIFVMECDNLPPKSMVDQAVEEIYSNWAHKFKEYMCGGNVEDELNCNSGYRCLLTSILGNHKLFFCGSMSCANPELYDEKMHNLSAFVCLKCSLHKSSTDKVKKCKMVTWALLMTLSGMGELIVGNRNEDGIIEQLESFTPEDLLREGKYFDLNVCFDFASEFLTYVKQRTESNPGSILYFKREPYTHFITCSEAIVDEFLPEWFTNQML